MHDRSVLACRGPRLLVLILAPWLISGGGCATFANVRSAAVDRGSSVQVQASASGHPGPVAGWFWSFDCDYLCSSSAPPGLDLNYTYGWRPSDDGPPVSLGAGVASIIPYVEGYVQLNESKSRPFGIGARVGSLGQHWIQEHVYARMDVPLSPNARLLWNPGFFHLDASSPNDFVGAGGTFNAVTQAVAVQFGAGNVVLTPSVAAVWGHAERTSWGQRLGPETRLFGTVGLAIALRHDPRATP